MSMTGIPEAAKTIADAMKAITGQDLPEDTKLAAAQLQAVIDHTLIGLDALLSKHEEIAAAFLDGFKITITFERKTP